MILVGSKNPHKLREVRGILAPFGIRAVIAVDLPDVEETGATFAENAAHKALAFAAFLRAPCLADDSGLVIPALGGEPGVLSARYAGGHGDDAANVRRVLEKLAERGLHEPEAYSSATWRSRWRARPARSWWRRRDASPAGSSTSRAASTASATTRSSSIPRAEP